MAISNPILSVGVDVVRWCHWVVRFWDMVRCSLLLCYFCWCPWLVRCWDIPRCSLPSYFQLLYSIILFWSLVPFVNTRFESQILLITNFWVFISVANSFDSMEHKLSCTNQSICFQVLIPQYVNSVRCWTLTMRATSYALPLHLAPAPASFSTLQPTRQRLLNGLCFFLTVMWCLTWFNNNYDICPEILNIT